MSQLPVLRKLRYHLPRILYVDQPIIKTTTERLQAKPNCHSLTEMREGSLVVLVVASQTEKEKALAAVKPKWQSSRFAE